MALCATISTSSTGAGTSATARVIASSATEQRVDSSRGGVSRHAPGGRLADQVIAGDCVGVAAVG